MKRSAVPSVALIIAAALVALLVYGVAVKGSDTTLDAAVRNGRLPQAPGAALKLPRLDGTGDASISDFRGKVLVVNVWASWCGPCADEAPLLQRTQAKLEADGTGTILGVTNNDFPNKSIAFEREHGLTFPSVRDLGIKLYRKLGGTGVPETFVLDAKGRIVALSRGQVSQAFLDRSIAKAKAAT